MSLTTAQLTTLKNNIAANANTVLISGVATAISAVPLTNQADAQAVADWYNLNASPNFWVWQSSITLSATGIAIKMVDVGNLTTANSNRLSVSFQVRPNGFNPSVQDDRALFGSVFSVAGASGTRANLIAAWQRLATTVEQLFATGVGSQVTGDLNSDGSVTAGSPGTLVVNGPISYIDIQAASVGHY